MGGVCASPYPGVSNEGLLAYLKQGNRLECPATCSPVWYAAMKICWTEDAEDRPAFTELVPFFTDLFSERENQSPFPDEIDVIIDGPQTVFDTIHLDIVAEKTTAEIWEITETEDGQNTELSVKNLINEI